MNCVVDADDNESRGKAVNEMKEKFEKVEDKLSDIESVIKQVTLMKPEECIEGAAAKSYAGATKKNLLIVKSTDTEQRASNKKDEISRVLEGIQIADAKFQKSGNVVLNFDSEQERDVAAAKVEEIDDLSVVKKKKMLPKIIICNVNAMEDREKLVGTLIERNDYLQQLDDIRNKIDLVFERKAAGGTKHYILKCSPDVRGLIHKCGRDKVKLSWGSYTVRTRYFATMCYHCSKFGHITSKCPDREQAPCCSKCAGEHNLKNCTSTTKKCGNCKRAGKNC